MALALSVATGLIEVEPAQFLLGAVVRTINATAPVRTVDPVGISLDLILRLVDRDVPALRPQTINRRSQNNVSPRS